MSQVATAIATMELTADELALIARRRAGEIKVDVEPPVTATPTGFMGRMLALNGTNLNRWNRNRPVAVINTIKGKRGVFWVGYSTKHPGELRVGTCKVTGDGFCYKPNKFDGAFYNNASELADLNK